jgi:hypothetical protein
MAGPYATGFDAAVALLLHWCGSPLCPMLGLVDTQHRAPAVTQARRQR